MLDIALAKRGIHVNWIKVQKWFQITTFAGFFFAAGGWFKSIDVKEQSLPYRDRATHQLENLQRKVGSKDPGKIINCLHRKADVAEAVAEQAIRVSNFSAMPEKALGAIPDCPHPKEDVAHAHDTPAALVR